MLADSRLERQKCDCTFEINVLYGLPKLLAYSRYSEELFQEKQASLKAPSYVRMIKCWGQMQKAIYILFKYLILHTFQVFNFDRDLGLNGYEQNLSRCHFRANPVTECPKPAWQRPFTKTMFDQRKWNESPLIFFINRNQNKGGTA